MPLNLVFNRIFDGDDLVFVGLDLVHRGVQRGRLAAARRSRHQHHPVRFFDIAPELAQIFLVEPDHVEGELLELLAHRLFVEHAQHRVFAVNRGHDGNAEVDGAAAVLHPEAPVLGHAPLGNIELAHDLDTRNHGRVMFLADRRHGLREHAVDAELDDDRVVAGLNVNVRGPPLQRGKDRGIDQPDDRAGIARRRQLVDGQRLFDAGRFVFADDR